MPLLRPYIFFDLGGGTGFAVGPPDNAAGPVLDHFDMPVTGDDVGAYLIFAERKYSELLELHQPGRVGFEAPILPKKTSAKTVRKLNGLAGLLEMECSRRRLRCSEANVSTLKLWSTGHGHAEKEDMISAAQRFGMAPKTHDEADAGLGWAYMVHLYAPQFAGRFALGPLGAAVR